MPTLFLVGTPIGNLEDITLRALRILREVSLIAAEDTRTTGRLLTHYEIDTPMVSYHDFSEEGRLQELLQRLGNHDVALVSDAGMPGLSDPGYRLVQAALQAGIPVSPIPGPSAAVAALVSSGLPSDSFLFLGFLPRQQQARRAALSAAARQPATLVLYEAPHRLLALLQDVLEVLGDRQIAVARELTKLFEEIWRGAVQGAQAHFAQNEVRGEITVVIAGAPAQELMWQESAVRKAMAELLAQGKRRKEAAAHVAQLAGWRAKEVYRLSLEE